MFAADEPDEPPVIPPVTNGAGQLYVMPEGTISVPLAGIIVKAVPLHVVAVLAAIDGVGLTVTVTVKALPEQLPEVGVTV
jgi:hypothetical protein